MTEKDVLRELNVDKVGTFESNHYIVELDDDIEWGKIQSRLDKNDKFEPVDEESKLELSGGWLVYKYEDGEDLFDIELDASFDTDDYQIVITREKE